MRSGRALARLPQATPAPPQLSPVLNLQNLNVSNNRGSQRNLNAEFERIDVEEGGQEVEVDVQGGAGVIVMNPVVALVRVDEEQSEANTEEYDDYDMTTDDSRMTNDDDEDLPQLRPQADVEPQAEVDRQVVADPADVLDINLDNIEPEPLRPHPDRPILIRGDDDHRPNLPIPPMYDNLREILIQHASSQNDYNRFMNFNGSLGRDAVSNRDYMNALIDSHFDQRPRTLYINPILVGYLYRQHDFGVLQPMDIVRLSMLGLEVHRIQMGINRMLMDRNDAYVHGPLCCICLDRIIPGTSIVASVCGHIYCKYCYEQTLRFDREKRCGVCRVKMSIETSTRLYFRFNYESEPVCRRCPTVLGPDVNIEGLSCGDVYCSPCMRTLDRTPGVSCLGCRNRVGGNNIRFNLYPAH